MSDLNINDFNLENQNDTTDEGERILEPFTYIAQIPGKKIRTKLTKALNIWFNIPEETLYEIDNFLNMMHDSLLIFDDVQDASDLRRGVPTSHLIYGIHLVFSSVKYVELLCFKKCLTFNNPEVLPMYLKVILQLYKSQGLEIYWRDYYICPTIEEYKKMATGKTAAGFILRAEIIQFFSNFKIDLTNFSKTLGLFFQIRDDYMSLCSDEYAAKKTFCEDISEGKFSFPIIHGITSRPDDKRIFNILKQRTKDVETKKICLSLLKEFGSIDYTYNVLVKMREDLYNELKNFPENPLLMDILENDVNVLKF